jgi:hypothetical protein
MTAQACEACGEPRSGEAAVCPHCGARRGGVKAGLGAHQLSPAEVRALLITSTLCDPGSSQGLFETLVLPHPGTEGSARTAELILTVLCAPLILAGTVAVALRNWWRKKAIVSSGEAMPVLLMVLFGSLPLDLGLSLMGFSGTGRIALGLGAVAGLGLRAGIRSRADRRGRAEPMVVSPDE